MSRALLAGLLALSSSGGAEEVVLLRVFDRLERPVSGAVLCGSEAQDCQMPAAGAPPGVLTVPRPVSGAARVVVRAPGYHDAPLELGTEAAPEVNVRLVARGGLRAAFVARDPEPGEPLVVVVKTAGGEGVAVERVTRDLAPGRGEEVVVEDLPGGAYRVEWSGTGALPGAAAARVEEGREARLPPVVLERIPRISGRAVDETGEPVPGARVVPTWTWREPPPRFTASARGAPVVAGPDGRFVVLRERSTAVVLAVRAEGRRATEVSVEAPEAARPPDLDVGDVVVARGRAVRGRVTEAATGRPLEGAKVVAHARGTRGRGVAFEPIQASAVADEAGRFAVSGLDERDGAVLVVSLPGYATTAREVAEEEEVEVALGRGGTIEGNLCGSEAERLSAAVEIAARVPGGEVRGGRVEPSGRFAFDLLEPGLYTVRRLFGASADGDLAAAALVPTGESAQVAVAEGEVAALRLGCKALRVAGQVLVDGRPAPGLTATLVNAHATATVLTADEAGRFETSSDAPGRHVARVLAAPALEGARLGIAWCDVPEQGTASCVLDFPGIALGGPSPSGGS